MNLLNYYVAHPKQIGHCKSTLYKKKKSIILLKFTVLHDSHPWLHIRITWEGCDSLGLGWSPLGDSTVGAKVEKHCFSTFQLCFDSVVCL